MRNMQDELSGPVILDFVGGTQQEAVIDTVIMDNEDKPVYLMEGEDTIFNWSTITRVVRR